jgi:hypothetical protein
VKCAEQNSQRRHSGCGATTHHFFDQNREKGKAKMYSGASLAVTMTACIHFPRIVDMFVLIATHCQGNFDETSVKSGRPRGKEYFESAQMHSLRCLKAGIFYREGS